MECNHQGSYHHRSGLSMSPHHNITLPLPIQTEGTWPILQKNFHVSLLLFECQKDKLGGTRQWCCFPLKLLRTALGASNALTTSGRSSFAFFVDNRTAWCSSTLLRCGDQQANCRFRLRSLQPTTNQPTNQQTKPTNKPTNNTTQPTTYPPLEYSLL